MAATDERWFEGLWQAHADAVFAYARRRSDDETAGEVVAGTFLVAWRRRDEVPDEPLPWLYGVARRVLADQRRTRSRQARVAERLGNSPRHGSPADPSDRVARRDVVLRALDQLGEADREVLRLACWEQLTPKEAARVLGCSAPTFNVRLHRARRRLRRHLDGSLDAGRRDSSSTPDARDDRRTARGATDDG